MSPRAMTAAPAADVPPVPEAWLRELLRRRLLCLEYADFARCACRLLAALGYEGARLAGRHEWKGYNRPGGGGWDVEAALPGGIAPRRVVAQLKRYVALPVHLRSVDELAGACLRAGAAEGILITTSTFSQAVRRHGAANPAMPTPASAASTAPPRLVAPVRLIDGEELTALLVRHRLGVREAAPGAGRSLEIDEDFFEGLSRTQAPHAMPVRTRPRWRVTIRIFRSGSKTDPRPTGKGRG